jgi:cytochrome P450
MATQRPPGPRRPMVGALLSPGRDPLKLLTRMAREYGDIVYYRMGGERVYFVNHPQYIRDVLVTHQKNFTKSRGLERAKRLLGEGLLTSEGATHLRQRRLLQPAFHRDRIANYASVMVAHADRLCERWSPGTTVDVSKEMMRLTLSIVGKTLFSSDVESQADEVGVAVTEVLATFWFTLLPFQGLVERLPLPILRRGRASRARLDALIYSMIDERRATGRDHGDLLSMLLAVRDDQRQGLSPEDNQKQGLSLLSPQQVRDEAITLLLAGHETTANALTWTWYLLSQHPEVEARLHAEIDTVLAGRLPTLADIERLPLVEQIVTESMRLYPPAWIIGRRAIGEYTLGPYTLPPRAMIFMSPYVTQRDARFFPDPDRFDPRRWSAAGAAALPKFAYFPFGGGARQCIGEHFAWMELVLVVATISQRWQLRLVPNHPVVPQPLITLRAKHGMAMAPVRRTGARAVVDVGTATPQRV